MNVVSFFAPRPEHPKWRDDYLPMLALLEASCRRYGHRHIVLSDVKVDGYDTFVCELPRQLMPATIAAQAQYLRVHDSPVLFTGVDCVLAGDPLAVLARGFDIAMTVDKFPECPLNTGAMFVRDCGLALAYWEKALAVCGNEWGDDQKCLARVFNAPDTPATVVVGEGQVIDFLPMLPYHFAPRNVDDVRPATVVHFRGRRKAFMREYCSRHLGLAA